MNINGTNIGASTDAMKKAIEMPNLMLNLLGQTSKTASRTLNTQIPAVQQTPDLATITGKGKMIDIIA
ncbi:hypothetical protein DO021_09785 [Desulfobacter hydrogenophilus]|uniref:Motility protein n=2 Tax=Desulfobacter hydrogenophilus TaxID=2291 RepID=A0A328FGQ4_9BACT|nr:hypothetical protein [Desulfobacter hydrogenophilus]NDY72216.1 hypothetical protein [Desulfobacter hydrogenophilus]QBH15102.1 hypothetical protein EYB58_20555 [Desulfobacter hydrogenophilus]RAM02243.1 hypothetical protein DO021_09785 [Desulfobacter hydrogenophilus]